MVFRFLKENLPWFAPSAAIVFAASGYFDRQNGNDSSDGFAPLTGLVSAFTSESDAPQQPAVIPQQTAVIAPQPPAPTVDVSRSVVPTQTINAAAPVRTETAVLVPTPAPSPAPILAPSPALTEVVPLRGETPAPVQQRPVQNEAFLTPENVAPRVAPNLDSNPAAFFAAAQANLAGNNPCVEDLKVLARDTKIYFPSGGLTGADAGMAQARLIGVIAQNCPGVTIQVEGHSDPSGDPRVNLRLSQKRADAVLSRIAAAGIDTSKFVAVGMGDRTPSNVRGPQPTAYYDRRVEFSVTEQLRTASLNPTVTNGAGFGRGQWQVAPCVANLQRAVQQTKVFYSPGSVTVSQTDLNAAFRLARDAASCPQARLRIVGQHSDRPGSRDSIATGRLRAVALMSSLVAAGVDPSQIIIGAPSWSAGIPGQPGLSNSRVDFDVIREES